MQIMRNGELVQLAPEEIELRRAQEAADLEAAQAAALAEYMQEFRALRLSLLNVLAGIALAEDLQPDFKALRLELLDIPQVESVAKATTAAEAKRAIKLEYARIVSTAPAALVRAFRELED